MATAPASPLPMFYKQVVPLSSSLHADWRLRPLRHAPFLASQHAVPLTVDEFMVVQRRMPIVFASGDNPVPIALMALTPGANAFVDAEGKVRDPGLYVPAYVRRYPYLLARTSADREDLSLCFDPTAEAIGPGGDGQPLFESGQPSAVTQAILGFAEQYEQAARKTAAFVQELDSLDLLIEGEIRIQPEGAPEPFMFRGFQMVDEKRVSALDAETLQRLYRSGALALIHAHFFSLGLAKDVFALQVEQGTAPKQPAG